MASGGTLAHRLPSCNGQRLPHSVHRAPANRRPTMGCGTRASHAAGLTGYDSLLRASRINLGTRPAPLPPTEAPWRDWERCRLLPLPLTLHPTTAAAMHEFPSHLETFRAGKRRSRDPRRRHACVRGSPCAPRWKRAFVAAESWSCVVDITT